LILYYVCPFSHLIFTRREKLIFIDNAEKKGQEEIKKLEEHKGILIEGFRTQMRKIKVNILLYFEVLIFLGSGRNK